MQSYLTLSLISLLLAACTPSTPPAPTGPTELPATIPKVADTYPGNTAPPVPVEEETAPPAPGEPQKHPLVSKTLTVAGASLTYLSFDTRTHTIAVIDQANGPGSKYTTAAQVTQATNSYATINGGFFTPEGKPLGVVYHNGQKTGSLNTSSSLGSGVLYTDSTGANLTVTRRAQFSNWLKASPTPPKEALQTGPFLVENSLPVTGLKDSSPRIRSLLLFDGQHHFAIAQCESISLKNLAGALAQQPLPGFHIVTALNLDGGTSSDFHIPAKTSGGPIHLRKWLNKPARNHLIVKPQ